MRGSRLVVVALALVAGGCGASVAVQGNPDQREVGHSAFVYGITGRGEQTALYPSDVKPAWIAHDAPLLAAR